MKSSANRTIEITKAINFGRLPVFLGFMQRHLEKEQPTGMVSDFGTVDYQVPVDLLRLSVADLSLVKGVESVILTYRK